MTTITNTYAKIHSYSERYRVYGVAAAAVLVHVDVSSHGIRYTYTALLLLLLLRLLLMHPSNLIQTKPNQTKQIQFVCILVAMMVVRIERRGTMIRKKTEQNKKYNT